MYIYIYRERERDRDRYTHIIREALSCRRRPSMSGLPFSGRAARLTGLNVFAKKVLFEIFLGPLQVPSDTWMGRRGHVSLEAWSWSYCQRAASYMCIYSYI